MKRGPSIAKILDTRNLKALRLKFDVRAEHKIYEESRKAPVPVDPGGGTPDRGGRRSATTLHRVKPTDDLPAFSDWMD